jgi:DNA-binding CsgD family transcriptional regulator
MPLNSWRFEPTLISLGYRWATLVVGLLIALLAESRPGSERVFLLAPLAAAALLSALAVRSGGARWLAPALVGEVAVAVVAIWVTGHYESPLLLYLTAPVAHAALLIRVRLMFGLQTLAVVLFIGIVAFDPDVFTFRPGATIRDVSLLVLLPVLVLATRFGADRGSRPVTPLELEDDDRAIAAGLVAGRTYKEMGDELGMSPETVKVAVARVYRRVGARNRDEAVRVIRELGLLVPGNEGSAQSLEPS